MPGQTNPLLLGSIKYLGGQVVEVEPLFGDMACMRNVEREEYANLEILKDFFRMLHPESKDLINFIAWLQRIVQIQGMAMFPRTELTDLSAKAQTSPYRKKKDLGKIPEEINAFMEAMDGNIGNETEADLRNLSSEQETQ
jgi:hypothetical protein